MPGFLDSGSALLDFAGQPLDSPKSSEHLFVYGDHRPFLRRYWVEDRTSTIATGEFPKSLYSKTRFPHRLEEVLIYPTGSVNENVAPSPGSLAAQIVS